jgi:ArsR family transcriptional regulator, arsenate/arsenite/antimonite-responsive transcriptional repressor
MSIDMVLAPKRRRAAGEVCDRPLVWPEVGAEEAARLARLARALSDPVRVQLLDVLRGHAGEVCVCELIPLFDVGQPTISHHLKVLRDAGLVDVKRRGIWAYYHVLPGSLEELEGWLGEFRDRG